MWVWILVWVLLLVISGVYLGIVGRGFFAKAKDFGVELATAQRRLEDVQGQLERLGEQIGSPDDLAVFTEPARARAERLRAREDLLHARRSRRARNRPAWARDVN